MKILILIVTLLHAASAFYQNCNELGTGDLFLSSFNELKPNVDCSLIGLKCFEEFQENHEALATLLHYCDGGETTTFSTDLNDSHFQRLLATSADALQLFERNNGINCSRINVLKNVFLDNRMLYSTVSVNCVKQVRNPFLNLFAEDLLALNNEVWSMFVERNGDFDGGLELETLENAILKGNDLFLDSISRIFIYLPFRFFKVNSDALKLLAVKMSNLHQELLNLYSPGIQNSSFDQSCSICFDGFDDSLHPTLLNCGHAFHQKCIDPWLASNPSCPNCRKPIVQTEVNGRFTALYNESCSKGLAYEADLLLKKFPDFIEMESCISNVVEGNHLRLLKLLLGKDLQVVGKIALNAASVNGNFEAIKVIAMESPIQEGDEVSPWGNSLWNRCLSFALNSDNLDLLNFFVSKKPQEICHYRQFKKVCRSNSAKALENLMLICKDETVFTDRQLNKLYKLGYQNYSVDESIKIAKILRRFGPYRGDYFSSEYQMAKMANNLKNITKMITYSYCEDRNSQ